MFLGAEHQARTWKIFLKATAMGLGKDSRSITPFKYLLPRKNDRGVSQVFCIAVLPVLFGWFKRIDLWKIHKHRAKKKVRTNSAVEKKESRFIPIYCGHNAQLAGCSCSLMVTSCSVVISSHVACASFPGTRVTELLAYL